MTNMATGFYTYQNHKDGLCTYTNKRDAVRNAEKSRWLPHERPCVYSPTGKIVWKKD